MFAVSSKLPILFNCPLSLFHHRPSTILRLHHHHSLTCPLPPLSAVPHHLLHLSRSNSHFPIKSSQQFHSQSTSNSPQENNHVPYLVPPSHPWPELLQLLESISVAGYSDVNRNIKDDFVTNESLSMQFVDAACCCLSFAQDRPEILGWLPKDDIQVVIDDGTPFLFKSAIETEKRMRSFLQGEESSEATTIDLMKYILSYASNPIIHPERNIKEASESSARNLLRKMATFIGRAETSGMPVIEKVNGPEEDEKTPTNIGSNIIMKRGDWICQKCSFMNYAKNSKCLECEELRPQRQLTGSEWDCPQCNFFNYGRNMVCLKCECSRPSGAPLPIGQAKTHSLPKENNSGYAPFVPLPSDMFAKKPENNAILKNPEPKTTVSENNSERSKNKDIFEEEKSEKWFKKVADLHDVTDSTSDIIDDDFPEIMPIRKGENQFVVSKKKDRSLNSSTYKRQQAIEQGSNNGNFVPFVPFPPDYFAKKDNNLVQETRNTKIKGSENKPETLNGDRVIPENRNVRNGLTTNYKNLVQEAQNTENNGNEIRPENHNVRKRLEGTRNTQMNRSVNRLETSNGERATPETRNLRNGSSLEGSAVKETDPFDMSEEAKAERWFRRVAQIQDISELSQIPDEDFPSIMPMRKGVNRFVVSKRKTPLERRLTSPQYRKNLRTVNSEPMKNEGEDS